MSDDKRFDELGARLSRLEAVLQRIPAIPDPLFDPAPDDWGWVPRWFQRNPIRIPIPRPPDPGDPMSFDITRLNRVQLELALGNIKAERIRLDALEGSINTQLKQVG